MVTSTRERILDAAMELFGRQGFKATSIVQIERAAGFAEGSGSIYHYFRTKQAVLEAGVDRHLARLTALRDIQAIFTGLGDLRAELTMLGRYTLAELDKETDLLRIVIAESRTQPETLQAAVDQLIGATYQGFTGWLRERADLPPERADTVAAIGLGALFSSRLMRLLVGSDPIAVPDTALVDTWVQMIHAQCAPEAGPATRRDPTA